jgi:hypothetical protein
VAYQKEPKRLSPRETVKSWLIAPSHDRWRVSSMSRSSAARRCAGRRASLANIRELV